MILRRAVLLSLIVIALTCATAAQAIPVGTPLEFADPAQETIYRELLVELRCTVCQNQNLADSHAPLAGDLRRNIYGMVRAGKSREEVVEFMVSRYGDFVLYRPPFRADTFLLWFGPFIFLVVGAAVLATILRRRARVAGGALSQEERQRLERLTK